MSSMENHQSDTLRVYPAFSAYGGKVFVHPHPTYLTHQHPNQTLI